MKDYKKLIKEHYEKFRPSIFLFIVICVSLLIEKIFGHSLDYKFFNKIQELTIETNFIAWLIFIIIPFILGMAISYSAKLYWDKTIITIKDYKDFIMVSSIFPPLLHNINLFIEISLYISFLFMSFLTGILLIQVFTKSLLKEDYIEIFSTFLFLILVIYINKSNIEYEFTQITVACILLIILIYNFFKSYKSSP